MEHDVTMTSTAAARRPPAAPRRRGRVRRRAAGPRARAADRRAPHAFPAPSRCRWRPASRSPRRGGDARPAGRATSAGRPRPPRSRRRCTGSSPPAGTILHVRSVETQGGRTTTREFWQSADRSGGRAPPGRRVGDLRDGRRQPLRPGDRHDLRRRRRGRRSASRAAAGPCPPAIRSSTKVRFLLQDRRLEVTGRERPQRRPRPGRSRCGPTPAGPCGSSGWRPPTASRWSCATPAATRRAPAGHPLADLRGAARGRRAQAAHAQGRAPDRRRRARRRLVQGVGGQDEAQRRPGRCGAGAVQAALRPGCCRHLRGSAVRLDPRDGAVERDAAGEQRRRARWPSLPSDHDAPGA